MTDTSKYLAKVQFYKDYVKEIAAEETSARYMVQDRLLKDIQAAAAEIQLTKDVLAQEQAFVAEQIDLTAKALEKFGIEIF